MPLFFAPDDAPATALHVIDKAGLGAWLEAQDDTVRSWLDAVGFSAAAGETVVVPNATGGIAMAVVGNGTKAAHKRGRFLVAKAVAALPDGDYDIQSGLEGDALEEAALGWLLASYRFDRYNTSSDRSVRLKCPASLPRARLEAIANGEALTRDLINTPTSDMGPSELEDAVRALAKEHGAQCETIEGTALLDNNLPMIHTVGRASASAPRLIDLRWGDGGPSVTLVGKGVCFDTGGLNIKPGGSMGLMKKDMGGAAAVLGLAHMIMATGLGVRLRVLVPAVENSIDGSAYRPQDILTSRKGLTVEINNTDAEGRLVLADALTLADEDTPDCLISMATLTGAARVAVGPDLAPFYTESDAQAAVLTAAGQRVRDPLWRLPFWDPYETMIEPGIADLDNAPKGGFAGSITAALFLRRFVENTENYTHFDIYGWQPAAAPARPKGGVGQGTRALFEALPEVLGL